METSIMEEREELIVSPKAKGIPNPTLKRAHFLKPSLTSFIHELQPPFHLLPPPNPKSKNSLNISFHGSKHPQINWKNWVTHMHSKHQFIWKEVGIHDAIMNSTYKVNINHDLVLSFADKWCFQTNSFVFPWGEVTITLEDMIFLGGYSVLGDSVFSQPENTEEIKALEELEKVWKEFIKSRSKKVPQGAWMSKFMYSETRIEHEAFLALWLSRFVFPKTIDSLSKLVFPIAVRLSRGTKVALAPAILASLYKDLTLIKEKLTESREYKASSLVVWSPMQLVQIWVLERFPTLNFKPINIANGEPSFARWCDMNLNMNFLRAVRELGSEDFSWCSYGMWPCKFYNVKEGWVLMDSGLEQELESFARCLRVSELVGIDPSCIEQYLPHRVAMQFGLGQDIPGPVARADGSAENAWKDYTRPIGDVGLYFPSRFFEPSVTTRYLNWWNRLSGEDSTKKSSRSSIVHDSKGEMSDNLPIVPPGFSLRCSRVEVSSSSEEGKEVIAKDVMNTSSGSIEPSMSRPMQKPSSTMADHEAFGKGNIVQSELISEECKKVEEDVNMHKTGAEVIVPPSFPQTCSRSDEPSVKNSASSKGNKTSIPPDPKGKHLDNLPLVPPGFSPRCPIVEVSSSSDDYEAFGKGNIVQSEECKEVQKDMNMPETETETDAETETEVNVPSSFPQARSHSDEPSVRSSASSKADNKAVEMENIGEIKESKKISGDMSESEKEAVNQNIVHLEKENGESSSLHKSEILGSRFEGRISKLEKIVAYLKAAKLKHRLD